MTKVVESSEIYKNLSLEDLEGEVWKGIEGWEYTHLISNLGRVKRLETKFIRSDNKPMCIQCHILGQYPNRQYLRTFLRNAGNSSQRLVHRLVAQHFIPNPDNLPEVNHLDADKTNNAFWNLEWSTRLKNMQHAYANSLVPLMRGTRNGVSKLNESDVFLIKELLKKGDRPVDIAKSFNVGAGAIYAISYKKNWGWLH